MSNLFVVDDEHVSKDKLEDIFERQEEFMKLLEESDRLPPWPINLTTKQGQRMIKEIIGELQGELWEATYTLKNKMHRLTDDTDFDRDHYVEELGDSFAYFVEVCVLSGITVDELYKEYCKKNETVKERFRNGY